MRRKTYLTPEDQWDRTAVLWMEHEREGWLPAGFEKAIRISEWFSDGRFGPVRRSTFPALGIVRRPHKVFCVGDAVVFTGMTGQMRHEALCVTRKGRTIGKTGMYVDQYWDKRWEYEAGGGHQARTTGIIERIEWPGHLVGKRLDDPDIRSFVVESARARPHGERRSLPSG